MSSKAADKWEPQKSLSMPVLVTTAAPPCLPVPVPGIVVASSAGNGWSVVSGFYTVAHQSPLPLV